MSWSIFTDTKLKCSEVDDRWIIYGYLCLLEGVQIDGQEKEILRQCLLKKTERTITIRSAWFRTGKQYFVKYTHVGFHQCLPGVPYSVLFIFIDPDYREKPYERVENLKKASSKKKSLPPRTFNNNLFFRSLSWIFICEKKKRSRRFSATHLLVCFSDAD